MTMVVNVVNPEDYFGKIEPIKKVKPKPTNSNNKPTRAKSNNKHKIKSYAKKAATAYNFYKKYKKVKRSKDKLGTVLKLLSR